MKKKKQACRLLLRTKRGQSITKIMYEMSTYFTLLWRFWITIVPFHFNSKGENDYVDRKDGQFEGNYSFDRAPVKNHVTRAIDRYLIYIYY